MAGSAETMISEEGPLAYRAVRGGLWVALSSYFNVAFGFAANLVLTRLLAPEHFGVFALAGFFFSVINLRARIGIGNALGQRRETTGALLGTHLALDVMAGLATMVLAGATAAVLRILGYAPGVAWVVIALACVGVSDSLMATAWIVLDRDMHFGHTSLVSSLVFPLSYLPALWLALHGGGFWSLVAQNATYALLLLAGMWWVLHRRLPQLWQLKWRFDRRLAIELVRFGAVTGLGTLAWMLVGQFDNFLVGTFVSVAMLGFYDRAYRMAQWPTVLVSNVISRVAFYTYAHLQGDQARLERMTAMSLWLTTALALPVALAIFISAPDLVRLFYGERWLPSVLFLRFLVVYSLLRPLLDNTGSLFVATGHPRRTTIVAWAQAAVLMVAATPLTLASGVVGTCVGVGIAFAVAVALTYCFLRRTVAVPLWDAVGAQGVAALLAVAAYLLLGRAANLSALPLLPRLLAEICFAVSVFYAGLFALQRRQFLERLGTVGRLLRARA